MIFLLFGLILGASLTAWLTRREHAEELELAYDVGYSDGIWSADNGLRVLPTREQFYDQESGE